ncbi:MAG TPA: hypothetical protein VFK57_12600 [Vicinamibacterales bacterium]|nr:hypothetical protein [Vicinamibacterales bacterium]
MDWSGTRQEIEATKQRFPRDVHFFEIIDREVIAKRQKALLIFGGNHLYRHWWNPFANGSTPPNLIDLLEQKARGAVLVVMVHAFVERDVDLESRLKAWKAPAMAKLEGTSCGNRPEHPAIRLRSRTIQASYGGMAHRHDEIPPKRGAKADESLRSSQLISSSRSLPHLSIRPEDQTVDAHGCSRRTVSAETRADSGRRSNC